MAKRVATAISDYIRKLGKKGGKVSGAKRMEIPEELRREIASKAATARWAKSRAVGARLRNG